MVKDIQKILKETSTWNIICTHTHTHTENYIRLWKPKRGR